MDNLGKSGVIKDFNIDLKYSLEERDNKLFDDFYYRIFPGIDKIEFCSDMRTQRQGIDKIIYFKSGNKFTIDEKKRRTTFNDIALEYEHVFKNGTIKKGWIYKTTCDYIIYAIMPLKIIFVLPTILLKQVWYLYSEYFLKTYKKSYSQNNDYKSWNVFVPSEILLDKIKEQMQQSLIPKPSIKVTPKPKPILNIFGTPPIPLNEL